MLFTKVRFDGAVTELDWTQQLQGDTVIAQTLTSKEAPAKRLRVALAAFRAFVIDLIGVPDAWEEELEIRQVVLKEEENGQRGLVVTALRKVEKAKNRTLLLNTPYLAEAPADHTGDPKGYLDADTIEMINELELAALDYKNGERGEQLDAFANAPVAEQETTAPKPRKRKKGEPRTQVPGHGTVINPDSTEAPTDDVLRQLLLTVERDVPVDAIARWTSHERDTAQHWAVLTQQFVLERVHAADVPDEPDCVKKSATLPLSADHWTAPKPRLVSEDGVRAIRSAARGDVQ